MRTSTGAEHGEEGHLAEFTWPAMVSRCHTDLASARTREGDGVTATMLIWRRVDEHRELALASVCMGALDGSSSLVSTPAAADSPPSSRSWLNTKRCGVCAETSPRSRF
jgi:hypothetical protein